MTTRKCSTCKHYEPAPIWRKGWCRNPLLYSPQQSHLVGEDDLDCDRGMGNYWEAIESDGSSQPITTQFETQDSPDTTDVSGAQSTQPYSTPLLSAARRSVAESDSTSMQGGGVNQFGGSGRPGGTGGFGTGGGGNDDDQIPPYGPERDPNDTNNDQPFSYEVEERYWTDYLRIAIPVIAVILLLGLVWFWLASLLGDDNGDTADNGNGDDAGEVIVESPTPDADENVDENDPVVTPEDEQTEEEATEEPATIGEGATVVVANTDGAGVNVRSAPSLEAEAVDTVSEGTTMTITGPSTEAEGYIWWPVETDALAGYVVEDFIAPAE